MMLGVCALYRLVSHKRFQLSVGAIDNHQLCPTHILPTHVLRFSCDWDGLLDAGEISGSLVQALTPV